MSFDLDIRGNNFKFEAEDFTSIDEPEVLDYIDSLPAGDTFYDLGSCVGYFSLYAKNKGLDVYSFEVDPKNFGGLQSNVKVNGFDIKTFNIGVSSGDKRMWKLIVGQNIIGGHRKYIVTDNFDVDAIIGKNTQINQNFEMVDVQINSLDNIISEKSLPYPDHLKVDIDGSELDFLIGAPVSLKKVKTMIIEICVDSKFYRAIMEMILMHGFKLKSKHYVKNTNVINYWFVK